MNTLTFETPVAVDVGMGTRVEIKTLMEMKRFLTDWPPSRRTSVYATAVRACEAARHGQLSAEQARRAFESFAKCHQILWPDIDAFAADWAMRGRGDQHA